MAVFNEPTQWDHELGNNADVSTLPDDTGATTGKASFQKLFQLINQTPLEAGGVAPEREDFNALFKILGDSVFYGMNGGLASYNSAYDYAVGRFVVYNNTLYKCIQANGASSTVVAPDSVSPLGSDYWKDIENQDSTSLIPNQIIQSPVPLTDANLHLLDGALLSGSGVYADYVTMMGALYNADPTATCWTDEATWQSTVSTYGVCGKFVYDSVNNTLRLPKISGFIEGTLSATDLGKVTGAGLPNIEGSVSLLSATGLISSASVISGAFKLGTSRGARTDSTTISGNDLAFDASLSNSIYGNSSTVQPQSVSVYYYIVVGTVSKTDIQIDIDNVLTDLNGKADTDLSNTSPSQTFKNNSISWCMPDYSAGVSLAQQSTGEQTFTITDNGFLSFTVYQSEAGSYNGYIKINDNYICLGLPMNNTSALTHTGVVPVNKNDIVKFASNSTGEGYCRLVFYPCKGV